jgi:hypothetical protein
MGGMQTAGAGGPLTGLRRDVLVVDDPIKNAEEAYSDTIRSKLWDWWLSTAVQPNRAGRDRYCPTYPLARGRPDWAADSGDGQRRREMGSD